MNRQLPSASGLSELLSALTGRDVRVKTAKTDKRVGREPTVVSIYSDPDGAVGAICACALPAAASLGAALSMLPPGKASDAVKNASLDEMILENYEEICNVIARLVNTPSVSGGVIPPLALTGVHNVKDPETKELSKQVRKSSTRMDVELTVSGYDGGKLTVALV